jgi:hypothetical protein
MSQQPLRPLRSPRFYVGFAVADGRPRIIAVQSSVTFIFLVVAAAAVTGSPWLLRPGRARTQGPLAAPKPVRRQYTMVTAVLHGLGSWVVAAIIVGEFATGLHFG